MLFNRNIEVAKIGTSKTSLEKVWKQASAMTESNPVVAILDSSAAYSGFVHWFHDDEPMDALLHDCIVVDGDIHLLSDSDLGNYTDNNAMTFLIPVNHFFRHWQYKELPKKQQLLLRKWLKKIGTMYTF